MIRTRIAPSPTGNLHIGTARTALFNYLFAKQNGGEFLIRIEDTDKARSTKEFEKNILDGLAQLGLQHDGEITYQSKRTEIYKNKLEQLIKSEKAYISQETEGESKEVIRLKNPGAKVTFNDLILGEITFDTTELGDFVIAKNLEEAIFHFTVVVDDAEMHISHVIRGEDHISNTARHILIQEALGYSRPAYAHIPLILNPDRSKLSKRHGATALTDYLALGYLPAAMVNFLALMGWSPQAGEQGTDEEIFSLAELVERFSLDAIQKGGAVFNIDKLNWLNRQHLKQLPLEKQVDYVREALKSNSFIKEYMLPKITPILLDRASNFEEIKNMVVESGEFSYLIKVPPGNLSDLLKTTVYLPELIDLLEKVTDKEWENPENIKNAIWEFATEKGRGEVLGPMRIALTGREKSPDPFTISSIIGKKETIDRLKKVTNNR